MLTWCCRGDSPPAELSLVRDLISGIMTLGRGERGEHTRGSQANEEHDLSSVVAAQGRSRIPGAKAGHQEETIPHTQSKQSSLQSPIDVNSEQQTAPAMCAGLQEPCSATYRANRMWQEQHKHRPSFLPVLRNQLLHGG